MAERKPVLANQSIKIVHPNVENMILVPITKRMEIITSVQVCLISWMKFDYNENSGKKSIFLQFQSLHIVYPNEENMIVVPRTKRITIVMSIQDYLIHGWMLDTRKMVERKALLQIQSINIMYPNVENMIIVPITKRMEIITLSKFVSFHRWTLIIRKMVEKCFSCISKASISCIPLWRAWL